jgi:hypothetical protein
VLFAPIHCPLPTSHFRLQKSAGHPPRCPADFYLHLAGPITPSPVSESSSRRMDASRAPARYARAGRAPPPSASSVAASAFPMCVALTRCPRHAPHPLPRPSPLPPTAPAAPVPVLPASFGQPLPPCRLLAASRATRPAAPISPRGFPPAIASAQPRKSCPHPQAPTALLRGNGDSRRGLDARAGVLATMYVAAPVTAA